MEREMKMIEGQKPAAHRTGGRRHMEHESRRHAPAAHTERRLKVSPNSLASSKTHTTDA